MNHAHSDSRYVAGMFALALVAYTAVILSVFAWHRAGVLANHAAIRAAIAGHRIDALSNQLAILQAIDADPDAIREAESKLRRAEAEAEAGPHGGGAGE